MKSVLVAALFAATAAARSRSEPIQQRAAAMCGQWDSDKQGPYTIYNNLWGKDSGTGSQCTTVDSLNGDTLSWSTSWSWSGGPGSVKSYANVVTDITVAPLSSFSSIPSTWAWSYSGNDIIANVAYDLFTSSTTTGSAEYEIMIWLAALGGAGPISSTGSPVATVTIEGTSWDLFDGFNGAMHVFSFVAKNQVTNFNGDLAAFSDYLVSNQGLPTSQYLQSVGAGTEPFSGSDAVLDVSAFSLSTA